MKDTLDFLASDEFASLQPDEKLIHLKRALARLHEVEAALQDSLQQTSSADAPQDIPS
jgi:hypothetical protein